MSSADGEASRCADDIVESNVEQLARLIHVHPLRHRHARPTSHRRQKPLYRRRPRRAQAARWLRPHPAAPRCRREGPSFSTTGRGPFSGPTVATVEPSAIPVNSDGGIGPRYHARVSARGATTALDSHGPGCSAAPSSSATTPASTIVMPEPPCSCGTRTPVAPRLANPPHTSAVVPVGSSSIGRTWVGRLAFSARSGARCHAGPAVRR